MTAPDVYLPFARATLRALVRGLEAALGASRALPVNEHLVRALDALRRMG